jgi:hypothetical protein
MRGWNKAFCALRGDIRAPGKAPNKRVKVPSAELAVWGSDDPVTASPTVDRGGWRTIGPRQ